MFKKKKCQNCEKKSDKNSKYCYNCGYPLDKSGKKEDWGFLGKNDDFNENEIFSQAFDKIGGNMMINNLLKSAINMMENERKRETQKENIQKTFTRFEIRINGKKISPENIKLISPTIKQIPISQKETPANNISEENLKKLSILPREEPKTNIKRLANKIIYELEMPGVKSIEDVSIVQLENSIEVKSFSKNKIYSKRIPIKLPIKKYNLSKGKLVLELGVKN